jgi:DUF3040 family protein
MTEATVSSSTLIPSASPIPPQAEGAGWAGSQSVAHHGRQRALAGHSAPTTSACAWGWTVLSDRDQQALAAIERRLVAQDPALAERLGHRRRGPRWPGVVGGVLAGVVAPVIVLATVPTLPAAVIVIVLALVGRVAAMGGADDAPRRS